MRAFIISDNHDTLVGMRLAGIQGALVHTSEEAFGVVEGVLKKKDIAILAITEKAAAMIPDVMQSLRERGELPLVVEVPDRFGTNRGSDFLTRYVEEAIGVKM